MEQNVHIYFYRKLIREVPRVSLIFQVFLLEKKCWVFSKNKIKNTYKHNEVWSEGQNPYISKKSEVWGLSVSLCMCTYVSTKIRKVISFCSCPFTLGLFLKLFSQSKLIKYVNCKKSKYHFDSLIDYQSIILIISKHQNLSIKISFWKYLADSWSNHYDSLCS